MKSDFLGAYEILSTEIRDILARDIPDLAKMEACFMTALAHWEKLKEKIKQEEFDGDQEEIFFFKNTKPRFTGLVEYYTQCYQAMLFVPDKGSATVLYFWRSELKRIERFFALNRDFVQYYEQGNTDLDEIYFLRVYSDLSNFEKARVYDLDEATSSSHDWLVSKMIGLRMYRQVVEKEIEKLGHVRPEKGNKELKERDEE
jgi:hypothetical protein